jgi:hypothetical protein
MDGLQHARLDRGGVLVNLGVMGAWLAEIVVITYRSARQTEAGNNPVGANRPIAHVPLPSEYVASFIIYGALSFVPGRGAPVATAIGWGIVVATVLNLWDPATIGNAGGVAVKGGGSTKAASSAPVISPNAASSTGATA